MNKREKDFEISLINQPLDNQPPDDLGSLLNVCETPVERARRRWGKADVIKERREGAE